MDTNRFDAWAKGLATRSDRRSVLRGLIGLGGGAVAAAITTRTADAQWSVQVCLPDDSGGYTLRLVPKASVPYYVNHYGAVLPENGECPLCQGPCIPTISVTFTQIPDSLDKYCHAHFTLSHFTPGDYSLEVWYTSTNVNPIGPYLGQTVPVTVGADGTGFQSSGLNFIDFNNIVERVQGRVGGVESDWVHATC